MEIWKCMPKKKRPMNIEKDLRPITLSPQLSKSLEWYPREWLLELLPDIMDPHQYGSMRVSSTPDSTPPVWWVGHWWSTGGSHRRWWATSGPSEVCYLGQLWP